VTERLLIPISAHDSQAWTEALQAAYSLSRKPATAADDIVLVVPSRPQMKSMTIANHLGAASSKTLARGDVLPIASGVTLRAEGQAQLRIGAAKVILIAYYATDKDLEVLDGLANVQAIVAVPAHASSADEWMKRWTPVVVGQPVAAPVALIADAKLEKALETLTRTVNLGLNSLHPNDRQTVEQTFRILRAKSHSATGSSIKSWAIKNGWKAKAAEELEKIGQRLLSAKTKPSLAAIPDAQSRYDNW